MSSYSLICFDVDGTLADLSESELYPHVEAMLDGKDLHPAKIALVTNQGGPACRDAGWPWSDKYPTVAQVTTRIMKIVGRITELTGNIPEIYIAWAYVTKNGDVLYPKDIDTSLPCCDLNWRKPNPGMLNRAMLDLKCKPHETLMVGDGDEDRQAARDAGVDFMPADEYFGKVDNGSE